MKRQCRSGEISFDDQHAATDPIPIDGRQRRSEADRLVVVPDMRHGVGSGIEILQPRLVLFDVGLDTIGSTRRLRVIHLHALIPTRFIDSRNELDRATCFRCQVHRHEPDDSHLTEPRDEQQQSEQRWEGPPAAHFEGFDPQR